MEFRILGPLEVVSDGQALELGGAKQRTLLAVLLLHANRVVSQDELIDALWDDDPPDAAQKSLHVHVFGLRKLLGKERLQTKPPGYALRVVDGELDIDPDRVRVSLCDRPVYPEVPDAGELAVLRTRMAGDTVPIAVELQIGEGRFTAYGCDLTAGYVHLNSAYTT